MHLKKGKNRVRKEKESNCTNSFLAVSRFVGRILNQGANYGQCMALGPCMDALAYTDDAHGPAGFPGTNTNGWCCGGFIMLGPMLGFYTFKSLDFVVRHSFISCPLLLTLYSLFCMWLTALRNTKQQDNVGWWEETLSSVWDIIIETASSYQQLQGGKNADTCFCLAYYSPFINWFLDFLTHFPAIIVLWKI